MASSSGNRSLLSRRDIEAMDETHVQHPLNPASDVFLKRLAPAVGLERLALYIARVPPGKESFQYHHHERDEEFLVVLSGRGLAEIGDATFEVGPGDVMGFPAPGGPPHHLVNPFEEDLVYLMGGESSSIDVAHFPRSGEHLVFTSSGITLFSDNNGKTLTFADWLADKSDTGADD